jgi:hypothetical protein
MIFPSANHIAVAIVSACVETGEDPLEIAEQRVQKSRARHYAFQALRAVFPEAAHDSLAHRCGCSGIPKYFATNSNDRMRPFVGGPHKGKRKHGFWDEDVFQRVIDAVRAIEMPEEPAVEEAAADAPAADAVPIMPPASPSRPFISERQSAAYRMLQQAVANTAKLSRDDQ